jgi:Ca-activated chloride channel family protein
VELAFWWMLAVCAAVVVAGALVAVLSWRRRSRRKGPGLAVAHSERLTRLPAYRSSIRRTRAVTIAFVALLGVSLVAAGLLAARPVQNTVVQPGKYNRDIVLCLDVSGSMTDTDVEVLNRFDELSKGFKGERLSLVLFNASAAQVFPLTDDYAYVRDQLTAVRAGLDGSGDFSEAWAGTMLGDGASLIGDGLASCILKFGDRDSDRSRSVILATDNYVNGDQLMTLAEAGSFAQSLKVRVYGIDPAKESTGATAESQELESVVDATQGGYYALDSADTVPTIINKIEATQAALIKGQPSLIVSDRPVLLAGILLALLAALLVLAWRARL